MASDWSDDSPVESWSGIDEEPFSPSPTAPHASLPSLGSPLDAQHPSSPLAAPLLATPLRVRSAAAAAASTDLPKCCSCDLLLVKDLEVLRRNQCLERERYTCGKGDCYNLFGLCAHCQDSPPSAQVPAPTSRCMFCFQSPCEVRWARGFEIPLDRRNDWSHFGPRRAKHPKARARTDVVREKSAPQLSDDISMHTSRRLEIGSGQPCYLHDPMKAMRGTQHRKPTLHMSILFNDLFLILYGIHY